MSMFAADEYLDELSTDSSRSVVDAHDGGGQIRVAVDEIAKIPTPLRHHERSAVINRIHVVVGLRHVADGSMLLHGSHERWLRGIPRHREDVRATRSQCARYFLECRCRIQYVLEDVLRDDEIEFFIGERLPLEILRSIAVSDFAVPRIREEMCRNVVAALTPQLF